LLLFPRFRHRHLDGARGEDAVPLADLKRHRQRDRKTSGGREDHSHHGLVGKEDRAGECLPFIFAIWFYCSVLPFCYTIYFDHLVLPFIFAIWFYCSVLPFCYTIYFDHLFFPFGVIIWFYHSTVFNYLSLPFGFAIGFCHISWPHGFCHWNFTILCYFLFVTFKLTIKKIKLKNVLLSKNTIFIACRLKKSIFKFYYREGQK
jgi:hypothetical protein